MPVKRQYSILEPLPTDIRNRLVAIEGDLIHRAIAKGIIRTPDEAKIGPIDATDFGKTTKQFVHSFSSADTWEKYVDAQAIGDAVMTIVGIANLSADPKLLDISFSVGVPLRPLFQSGDLEAAYAQTEPKVLFTEDVKYDKGDKATIEVMGRATGSEKFVLMGLKCEKG
jgi:hypothetical protein